MKHRLGVLVFVVVVLAFVVSACSKDSEGVVGIADASGALDGTGAVDGSTTDGVNARAETAGGSDVFAHSDMGGAWNTRFTCHSTPCNSDGECADGEACNTAYDPAVCQTLGCGLWESPCDRDELCNAGTECLVGQCVLRGSCELWHVTCDNDEGCPPEFLCNLAKSTPKCTRLGCGALASACMDDSFCAEERPCIDGRCAEGPHDCPGDSAWACDFACATSGRHDPHCFGGCDDPRALAYLERWRTEGVLGIDANDLPPEGATCDRNVGTCDVQFGCSTLACFCDPDCAEAGSDMTCWDDGHCDSACPSGQDPDCEGSPEDGAQCE